MVTLTWIPLLCYWESLFGVTVLFSVERTRDFLNGLSVAWSLLLLISVIDIVLSSTKPHV